MSLLWSDFEVGQRQAINSPVMNGLPLCNYIRPHGGALPQAIDDAAADDLDVGCLGHLPAGLFERTIQRP